MYAPGSLVVYRHHVCEVAAVREDYYDGKDYLELHALFQNSLKLFVSAEEAHLPTLRPVMTKKEALALVDSIADADGIDENSFELGANTPTVLELSLIHILVATSTSSSPALKCSITRSSSSVPIWPCATPTRASPAAAVTRRTASSMERTRLDT